MIIIHPEYKDRLLRIFPGIIFVFGLVYLILPVWVNDFFLTQDGPSHLYNAKVLLDWTTGKHIDFYSEFFRINDQFSPNWFTHVLLALLLWVLPIFWVEKVFFSIFFILGGWALWKLVKRINPENSFIAVLGLPLLFPFTLQLGFYNFSLSIIFVLLALDYWFSKRSSPTIKHFIIIGVLQLLLFFTHIIGLFFFWLLAGCYEMVHRNWKGLSSKRALYSLLVTLPTICFVLVYLSGSVTGPVAHASTTKAIYEFIKLSVLMNLSSEERFFTSGLAIFWGICFIMGSLNWFQSEQKKAVLAFLIPFLLLTLGYFILPDTLMGGGLLSMRLQYLAYIAFLLSLATLSFHKLLNPLFSLIGLFCLLGLQSVRVPILENASEVLVESVELLEHMEPESTYLPLSYNHNGKLENGSNISNRTWFFLHAAEYAGAHLPLINMRNYEAHTSYFPLKWIEDKDPFTHLRSEKGIEALPPGADMRAYFEKTGKHIDYISLWFFEEKHLNTPHVATFFQQLQEDYELVKTSGSNRIQLYRRKSK